MTPHDTTTRVASSSRIERVATVALLVLAAGTALRNVLFYFPRTVDDLFISLRYADNLVRGHGLTYNPGEWVEGYSSLSWALLQAAGIAVGFDGLTATKLLALGTTVFLFFGLWRMARELFAMPAMWAAATLALVGTNSYVLSWCLYGLETPLHLTLLVWFAVWVRRVSDGTVTSGGMQPPSSTPAPLPVSALRRAQVALGAVGIAATLTRPEVPLLLMALGPGAAGIPRNWEDFLSRLRRLGPPAGAVILGYGAWLLIRQAVYGLWVPHTYYAKQGDGLTFSNLAPMWSEGAVLQEQLWWPLAAVTAVVMAVTTRRLVAPLLVAIGVFFLVRVEMDWMPNMRHYLPMWLVTTLALGGTAAWLAQRARAAGGVQRWAYGIPAFVLAAYGAWTGMHLQSIDSRFSPYDFATHGRGETWVRTKSDYAWASTMALLRHQDPPGFENANPDGLGLIQQTFVALEASSEDEASTWFLGRDIGMVGYYSPMLVYDTDGLFTPESIVWTEGRDREPIEDGAILQAFARRFVAGEIYFEWTDALGRNPQLLDGYEVTIGSRRRPHRFVQTTVAPPDATQVQARYDRVRANLPTVFHFSELYGNPASPAIHLRARVAIERAQLATDAVQPQSALPTFAGDGHTLDRHITLHGCTTDTQAVDRGGRVQLSCWFQRTGTVRRPYRVFVHGLRDGNRVLHADHPVAQGSVRLQDLTPDQVVVSRTWIQIPTDIAPGPVTLHVGLFEGDHRAVAAPAEGTDGQSRVAVGVVEVR